MVKQKKFMIAGKTYDEIVSMKQDTRKQWYKTITPEEREKAKQIVEIRRRTKISKSHTGMVQPKETKDKRHAWWTPERRIERSITMTEQWKNPKRGNEHSARMTGENNPNFGRTNEKHPLYGSTSTEETRIKQSVAWTPERRLKHSKLMAGEKNPSFNNWSSREPYCHLWNDSLKEEVRNRWGRICVLSDILRSTLGSESGLDNFEGYEIFSEERLSVHHVKGDKMAGCNGNKLALIPLQRRFNSKKFNGLKLEENPFYITLFLLKNIERKHREEEFGK